MFSMDFMTCLCVMCEDTNGIARENFNIDGGSRNEMISETRSRCSTKTFVETCTLSLLLSFTILQTTSSSRLPTSSSLLLVLLVVMVC